MIRSALTAIVLALLSVPAHSVQPAAHVWELQEIELRASGAYANPYVDVECWVDLAGPGFSKRVYGFWDGGDTYRVRIVATRPGPWSWTSGSNQPGDDGLNGRTGGFTAASWTEDEKRQNPNRRGFLQPDAGGHALQYADGTPFFLLGDTWLGAATWRLPLTGAPADPGYRPEPGVTFEQAVALRKRQGFNSVSMIAAFPTWVSDQYPGTYADRKGVFYRNGWEAFGILVPGGQPTAKSMHDERGFRPFEIVPGREGLPDYDRLVPAFFRSLDRKMQHLGEQGFVAMLETIRRDVAPPWKAYFDFNASYARFLQYMVARYGAYNMIFSKVHFDIYLPNLSLTAGEFNEAINHHYRTYGPMPFGQPVTSLIDHATDTTFGTGEKAPWITMHSTGNKPRDHGIYAAIERQFRLSPAMPTADLEPHYTGWVHGNNVVNGEQAESGSDRDNYFSRAQMYGCVLSGGLAGHVHGTGAYDVTSAAEPAGARPHFWEALAYASAEYMRGLGAFVLSEGTRYRDLRPASEDLSARKTPGNSEQGLDGWSFLMRTPDRSFGLLYFENQAARSQAAGWRPGARYRLTWFDPREGTWRDSLDLMADRTGTLALPPFPGGLDAAATDWAAKIVDAASAMKHATSAVPDTSGPIGLFDRHGDVGPVKIPGSATYDAGARAYTVRASGRNMWLGEDEFHAAWKSVEGDFILQAQIAFPGKGVDPHRKAGLIVRSSLTPGSPHVNVSRHGDGLTSLQFRRAQGATTEEIRSAVPAADVLQIERKGDTYTMSVARFGDVYATEQVNGVALGRGVHVGIFVCSHNPDVSETTVFRNVRLVRPAREGLVPYREYLGSGVELLDVTSGVRRVVHQVLDSIQAPNWTLDGKRLIMNRNGRIYSFDLASRTTSGIDTGSMTRNNNDHALSFDGKLLGLSGGQPSVVFTVPAGGGEPRQVTPAGPSYLHGWSPDGKYLAFTGQRNGDYDIYLVPSDGGPERRLTTAPGLDDGPEYSPDGKWIYFNSARTGRMQVWRMRPDGSGQEQLTFDEFNNWFPHVSPDGKTIVFITYGPEIKADDHPWYKRVYLRKMPAGGGTPSVVAYLYGGQGTINVNSWSPDSRQIAFVANSGTF